MARGKASSIHQKNISLMQWLSRATQQLGVAKHTYVVGGAVRNFLIDVPIKDIDLVIDSIRAKKDSAWLAGRLAKLIPTQTDLTTNQYGVAILSIKGDWELDGVNLKGEVIEIANARKEAYGGEGGKGYKPHMVQPAKIEEDIVRREFTVNTLLWRLIDLAHGPEKAEVIDLMGCGKRDLAEGELRCPRDPNIVFSEDPTRILRSIKFTGKYGFKIPNDLAASIKRNAPKMKRMPWEAIATILVNDILNQPTARASLKQMKQLGILDVVSEMIQESKPFATYMANQLRSNRKVQLLLDLMDLGVPAKTPLSFLSKPDQQRVRELTIQMNESEASKFVDALITPPVDSMRVIEEFDLPPKERSKISERARSLILSQPHLAEDRRALTESLILRMKKGKFAGRAIPVDKSKVRRIVKEIYQKLESLLRQTIRPSRFDEKLNYAHQWPTTKEYYVAEIELVDVTGQRRILPIYVRSWMGYRVVSDYVLGGAVKTRLLNGRKGRAYPQRIEIYLNAFKTPEDYVSGDKRFIQELYQVLIHEVTHAMDYLRKSQYDASNLDEHLYLNDPMEVRAFTQNIVDEVLTSLKKDIRMTKGWGDWESSETIDRYLQKSLTWHRLRKTLTPENKKKVLKAVARAVSENAPKWKKQFFKEGCRLIHAGRVIPVDKLAISKIMVKIFKKLPSFFNESYNPTKYDEPISSQKYSFREWRDTGFFVDRYNFEDVSGRRDRSVAIYLKAKPGRGYVVGGTVHFRGKTPETIDVYLNANRSPNEFLKASDRILNELRHVLLHEITHARDFLENNYSSGISNRDDQVDYLNHPNEVRAFMQNIVYEVLTVLKTDLISSKRKWSYLSSRALDQYLQRSPHWKSLREFLTEGNKKKILKAVAREASDLVDEHNRKYSVGRKEPNMKKKSNRVIRLPNRKTLKIDGKTYVLSKKSFMLPEADRYYLWALDVNKRTLTMWRVSDGEEKLSNPMASHVSQIRVLDQRGELNRVSHQEFLKIERWMRRKNDKVLKTLQKSIRDNESQAERDFRWVATQYWNQIIVQFFREALIRYEGVTPIDFKYRPQLRKSREEQLASHWLSKVINKYWQEDKIFQYAKKRNTPSRPLNLEGLGAQDPYFIMSDLQYELTDETLDRWKRKKLAAKHAAKVDIESLDPHPETDRKGNTLAPGDRVRLYSQGRKGYPGSKQGTIELSRRAMAIGRDGKTYRALVVRTSDGTTYDIVSRFVEKLR